MCLTTLNPEIKVADRDIKVYKELDFPSRNLTTLLFGTKKGKALYNSHTYEKGELQPIERLYVDIGRSGKWTVHLGYHSDKEKQHRSNALFIIPKGTKYVQGWFNDDTDRENYVSETIIFKKRLW